KEALAPETSQALDQAMAAGLGLEALPLKTGPNAAFDLLVDALVGTGAVLPLRGSLAEFALWMDGQACPVVALDLPSGVDGDSGAADGPCVNAALTVTFLAAKPGLFLEPGRSHAGAVRVHHFAGPGLDGLIKAESKLRAFDQAEAAAALPPRPYDAHKKQAAVLVVAGSKAYLGAALLCARAAYRGGAGIVRLALPEALAQTAVAALPEAVILALPGADCLGQAGLETLLTAAKDCGAMVVGPGLGRAASTQALVRALWRTAPLPALFDADALHALALGDAPAGPRVLTPHEGELKALLGPAALESGRPAAARALASAASAVALLKGPATLVAGPDGALSINTSGSAALASAGTGDVLSGLIGALLAQGAAAFDAASLGAWIHGRAGDRWAAQNAGRGLLASDLADGLPAALQEIGA
ncbi:MAG TPA: NAD(P)H-hydrate dehydratase, partial [bacterium]|nr:NAD(P)H-hydrate dehydratase [bacterium]